MIRPRRQLWAQRLVILAFAYPAYIIGCLIGHLLRAAARGIGV